jgi:mannose-6-phosphate isomerase-like protein (cupin superfamily)
VSKRRNASSTSLARLNSLPRFGSNTVVSYLIDRDQLSHTPHSHELIGNEHELPISLILVHSGPGTGPAMHRHPYPEVFVIESGRATFHVDGAELVGQAGQIVIAPANAYHGFTNTGTGELRLTAIHTASVFDTEWLSGPDADWVTPDSSA